MKYFLIVQRRSLKLKKYNKGVKQVQKDGLKREIKMSRSFFQILMCKSWQPSQMQLDTKQKKSWNYDSHKHCKKYHEFNLKFWVGSERRIQIADLSFYHGAKFMSIITIKSSPTISRCSWWTGTNGQVYKQCNKNKNSPSHQTQTKCTKATT